MAVRYELLTADRLVKRGWIGPSICSLCCADGKNLDHLFFTCPYAVAVWEGILFKWPLSCVRLLDSSGDLATRWRMAREPSRGPSQAEFDTTFAAGCWELWIERNKKIFDNLSSPSAICASRALNAATLLIVAFAIVL